LLAIASHMETNRRHGFVKIQDILEQRVATDAVELPDCQNLVELTELEQHMAKNNQMRGCFACCSDYPGLLE